jgi:hypothetical protein
MDSMFKARAKVLSNGSLLKFWGPAVVVTLAGFVVAWQYVEPPPPDRVRLCAGDREGAYYAFAQQYAEFLAAQEIELEVVETTGAVDNVKRLEKGECDVGFVQGGVGSQFPDAPLESLASLYFEPLWVFYRAPLAIERLTDLQGTEIAVGEEDSGTRLLALELLVQNAVSEGAAYRLASVRVLAGGRDVAGATRLASTTIDRDTALIGVVPAGTTARGIVTVRSVDAVLGRPLALELAMPGGKGAIRADRGIVLR